MRRNMKYISNNKGQGLVGYAIIITFAIVAGFLTRNGGLLAATRSLFEPTKVVLAEIDHHRTHGVVPAIQEIIKLQTNGHYQVKNSSNCVHYLRGMMRSGWVEQYEEDYQNSPEIKNLYDEIGARQWSYLNGLGQNYNNNKNLEKPNLMLLSNGKYNDKAGMYIGDQGLYWTVQDLTSYAMLLNNTAEKNNYSFQLVLQYFYSTITNRYYVIKSHVWLNQGDVANHITLGGLHQHYGKPPGYFVGSTDGYATLGEAKVVYENERLGHNYVYTYKDTDGHTKQVTYENCVVFNESEIDETKDTFAGNYGIVNGRFVDTSVPPATTN